MAHKHAHTIQEDELPALLKKVTARAKQPEIMRVAFLLSYHAGLRVQEIAGLEWDLHVMNNGELRMAEANVIGPNGRPEKVKKTGKNKKVLQPTLFVNSTIGKYGKERNIPMHSDLAAGLKELYEIRDQSTPYVIPSGRDGAGQGLKKRAHALKMRINRLYIDMGKNGFTSHSGRRSFITNGARKANLWDNSLVDVQRLAGHRNLTTTQAYVDESPNQAALVENLYAG